MAAEVDLSDGMGNAAHGLHMATMGGLWQAAVMGCAGLRRHDEALVLDPHLPEDWTSLSFALRFRGARLRVSVRPGELDVAVVDVPATVVIGRRTRRLAAGEHRFRRRRGTWEEER